MRGIEQIRGFLDERGLDVAYISNPLSIGYVTGFHSNPHERLLGLVVDRDQATLVAPGLEAEAARAASDVEVRPWADGTDAWAVVGEVLGGRRGGVAIEGSALSYNDWTRLRALVADGEPADLEPLIAKVRAVKDSEELEFLATACSVTDEAWIELAGNVRPGLSELELLILLNQAFAHRGFASGFAGLLTGPKSALPHGRAGDRRISEGDFLLADFGAAYKGYKADLTRTLVLGEADARQQEVHSVVRAANEAALAVVAPGVLSGEVDEAARRVIRDAGYGDYFIHRIGHGLGLDVHEYPSLDPGSAIPLEENMVVTIEPGIYIPDWGGVRVEDDAVVTSDGARLLTHSSRDLHPVA
jgi:Xaa-Pro dipeptidase